MKTLPLKTHVELAGDLCRKVFDLQKELHPMIYAVDSKGEHHLLMVPQVGGTDDEKDLVSVGLRKTFKELDIVQYVLMTEAWTVALKTKPGDPLPTLDNIPRPSQHPDRIEVITLQGETKDQYVSGQIVITRDANNKPSLGQVEVWPSDMSIGRLAGLLSTEQ